MELEHIFLIDYVKQQLNKIPQFDTYTMSDGHCKTRDCPNEVPMMRIDIRSATWDIEEDDDDWKALEYITERMWEEFEEYCEWIKEDTGVTIFTDMNGYRVLCSTNISDVLEGVNDSLEEIEFLQAELDDEEQQEVPDQRIRDYIESEIDKLSHFSKDLKEEAGKVEQFLKLEERLKEWVKDYPKYYAEWKAEEKLMLEVEE